MKNHIDISQPIKSKLEDTLGRPFGKYFVTAEFFHNYYIHITYHDVMSAKLYGQVYNKEGEQVVDKYLMMSPNPFTRGKNFFAVKEKAEKLKKQLREELFHKGYVPKYGY